MLPKARPFYRLPFPSPDLHQLRAVVPFPTGYLSELVPTSQLSPPVRTGAAPRPVRPVGRGPP